MACVCTIRKAVALGLVLLAAAFALPGTAPADQIKGSVEVKVEDGFARLVFTIGDEIDASARLTGGVLVVTFTKPVFVSVERLVAQAPDYISAARRDPDGKSIRMALARKLTVNTTGAAEWFFVDLMPESWSGPPPGLPSAVVEDLARRAREADRLQRLQRRAAPQPKIEPALASGFSVARCAEPAKAAAAKVEKPQQGKWAQARDRFKNVEASIATLPVELQRVALKYELRAAIEVGDFRGAADQLNDFETIGVPRELQPGLSVLVGRLAEGAGHSEDALTAYRAAVAWDRPAAAQGRLRETALRYALGDLKRPEVITELESLTTVWRGDETEIEALKILARLYTADGRYRDAFYVTFGDTKSPGARPGPLRDPRLVMPENRQEDDDRQRDAQQPKQ
jgi:hypothetical protein